MSHDDASDYAGIPAAPTYTLVEDAQTYQVLTDDRDGHRAFRCKICLRVSHHPQDVANRYCGACHLFHTENL